MGHDIISEATHSRITDDAQIWRHVPLRLVEQTYRISPEITCDLWITAIHMVDISNLSNDTRAYSLGRRPMKCPLCLSSTKPNVEASCHGDRVWKLTERIARMVRRSNSRGRHRCRHGACKCAEQIQKTDGCLAAIVSVSLDSSNQALFLEARYRLAHRQARLGLLRPEFFERDMRAILP